MGIMQALMGSYGSAVAAATDLYYHFVSLLVRGDTVADLSDNSLTVTASNGASVDTGTTKFSSGSLSFDGVDDIVGVANDDALDLSTGDWTIECWAYHDGQMPANCSLFGKRAVGSNYAPFILVGENNTDATKALRFFGSATGSGWDVAITGTTDFPLDQWVHVAVTRSGNVYTLWQNGVSIGTDTVSGDLMTNTAQVTIGQSSTGSFGSNNHWKGNVENFRITKGIARYISDFSSDLPSASFPTEAPSGADPYWPEVTLLLNGTSTTDLSTAGNDFINDGADLNQAPSPDHPYSVEPGAFGVTGPNDTGAGTRKHLYSSSGAFNTLDTGPFTIEMWAKADDLTGPRGIFCIGPYNQTTNVVIRTDGTTLEACVDGTNRLVTHQTALSTGTWHHIALVWDGSETRVYLDGVKSTASDTNAPDWSNGRTARIGRHYDDTDGYYWDGQITDVRITEGVARYTADFSRPSASFPTS